MADRFEELRTYVAVVEAGGVNAAAARISIARSAVSRRLSELEARLGATLIERSTRRFELTDMGRALFEDSKRVLGDLATLENRFASNTSSPERLTVSLGRDAAGIVALALTAFATTREGLVVDIIGPDDPSAGAADIKVSASEGGSGRRVGEFQLVVVCSPSLLAGDSSPSTPSDLADRAAISVRGAVGEWMFRRGSSAQPRIAFEVANSEMALALAQAGAGFAHLPRHICAQAIENGELTVVLAEHQAKPVALVAEASSGSALAASLVDALVKAHR